MGIAVGGYTTTVPLYISEISPISLMGMLGSLIQIQGNLGSTIAFIVAFAAPYSDDSDVNTNQNWRLIYALPVLFSLAQAVLFLAVFRYDTPKFYKIKGDEANYHKAMSQIYSNYENEPFEVEGSKAEKKAEISCSNNQLNFPEAPHENQIYIQNENVESQPDRFETNMQIESKVVLEVTKNRTPCYYWKALILWMWMAFFHQFTGINAVLFFSNQIFTNGKL